MTLHDVKVGETVRVVKLGGNGELRQHFLDMGIIPGAEVTFVKYAPLGDPMEFRLHGYELTLRVADAQKIEVEPDSALGIGAAPQGVAARQWSANGTAESPTPQSGGTPKKENGENSEHPGLGESGKFHDKKSERPLPDGTVISFALVGNQNCGKTTLFNKLTVLTSTWVIFRA